MSPASVTRSNKLGPEERAAALANMRAKELDVLVIGGGIVGAGAALDAAARGLRVALVERGDYQCINQRSRLLRPRSPGS